MNVIYNLGWTFYRCILEIFFDYKVFGYKNIPQNSNFIIVANHTSYLDPPIVGCAFGFEINYFARNTLFDSPLKNYILRRTKSIPINRDNPSSSSIKEVIKIVKKGESLVLFPEGRRAEDGRIQEGKNGISMILAKTGVPLIPARIFGAFESFPKGNKIPKINPITMVIGEEIDLSEIYLKSKTKKEKYDKISSLVMSEISSLKLPK